MDSMKGMAKPPRAASNPAIFAEIAIRTFAISKSPALCGKKNVGGYFK